MSSVRNPVGWFEIYVQDLDRAKSFYGAVFGYEFEKLDSPTPDIELWAFPMAPEAPGATGALVKMKEKDAGLGGVLIYFSCEDCAVQAEKAAQNGGRIHCPKNPIGPYGFIALVYDTEGNMIGLHSMQ